MHLMDRKRSFLCNHKRGVGSFISIALIVIFRNLIHSNDPKFLSLLYFLLPERITLKSFCILVINWATEIKWIRHIPHMQQIWVRSQHFIQPPNTSRTDPLTKLEGSHEYSWACVWLAPKMLKTHQQLAKFMCCYC